MLKIQFIKRPTNGTLNMLFRRSRSFSKANPMDYPFEAVGLVQGPLADIIASGDIAEKTSGVTVEEIFGICPQHFTMIAIFGDTASVSVALQAVKQKIDGTTFVEGQ